MAPIERAAIVACEDAALPFKDEGMNQVSLGDSKQGTQLAHGNGLRVLLGVEHFIHRGQPCTLAKPVVKPFHDQVEFDEVYSG